MDVKSEVESSTAIHGDRHITFSPAARGQIVMLTTNVSLSWAARKTNHGIIGNIALTNGNMQKTTNHNLTDLLLSSSQISIQRLLFP